MVDVKLLLGDCLEVMKGMADQSVNCIVTSPPYYGLRDYGVDGQIGLEETPEDYVNKLVSVFREARRVLRDDGTLWLNLGDSYAGNKGNTRGDGAGGGKERGEAIFGGAKFTRTKWGEAKEKDLIGIPWMVAFALRADGWYLRQDIIWHKPNPMPESVKDRCTKAHEYIFLLSKSQKYYYDYEAIQEYSIYAGDDRGARSDSRRDTEMNSMSGVTKEMRNKRSVWTVTTKPYKEAHFATYPPDLIEPCVLAGCPKDGTVLDPFNGAGTTGVVSVKNGRNYIGIEINSEYIELSTKRINGVKQQLSLF